MQLELIPLRRIRRHGPFGLFKSKVIEWDLQVRDHEGRLWLDCKLSQLLLSAQMNGHDKIRFNFEARERPGRTPMVDMAIGRCFP